LFEPASPVPPDESDVAIRQLPRARSLFGDFVNSQLPVERRAVKKKAYFEETRMELVWKTSEAPCMVNNEKNATLGCEPTDNEKNKHAHKNTGKKKNGKKKSKKTKKNKKTKKKNEIQEKEGGGEEEVKMEKMRTQNEEKRDILAKRLLMYHRNYGSEGIAL